MGLRVYKDPACTQPIQTEVGRLVGDDSTTNFICTGYPSEVRKYSTTATNGTLLSETVDYSVTDNGDGTYTVTLTSAPATGEIVVAVDDGEKIFADLYAIGNSPEEANRTLEQQLFIKAENVNAQNVIVALDDYVADSLLAEGTDYTVIDNGDTTYTVNLVSAPSEGQGVVALSNGAVVGILVGDGTTTSFICSANPTEVYLYYGLTKYFYSLAPDSSGSPGGYGNPGSDLNLGSISSGDVVPFWIKCVIPEGTPMSNYRDINVKITGLQFATN